MFITLPLSIGSLSEAIGYSPTDIGLPSSSMIVDILLLKLFYLIFVNKRIVFLSTIFRYLGVKKVTWFFLKLFNENRNIRITLSLLKETQPFFKGQRNRKLIVHK